jgi:Rps23 Pro-64 3,4-dihydroxylase Tpa1-like proline 4-hydroxylase
VKVAMEIFNPKMNDQQFIDGLKKEFNEAQPYRHIKIDDFLSADFANSLYDNFPPLELLSRHYHGLNENKSEGADFNSFDKVFTDLRAALNTEEFKNKVEHITGIKDIFSTEDALGCGVHQGKNGSYLDVHIDFNIHHIQKIHRRLNLLVYLNKNWKEEYGGKIELWNKDVTALGQAYLPTFNRCVIFETSEISYHGYSTINVPEGETRKSFYAYYYTQPGDYKVQYHDTVFKARPEEGTMKKIKTDVKESLKNNIKRAMLKLGIKF